MAFIVLAATIVVGVFPSVLRPAASEPGVGEVDALVVLAGGTGERLDRAVELMEVGAAPVLLVSLGNVTWQGRSGRDALCAEPPGFTVICREVSPDNTLGEAGAFSQLAEDEGFETIGVVTSTYHLRRSSILFRRCFEGTVLAVEAEANTSRRLAVHETLGIFGALFNRDCSS